LDPKHYRSATNQSLEEELLSLTHGKQGEYWSELLNEVLPLVAARDNGQQQKKSTKSNERHVRYNRANTA
jgi:hypothetical protein